MLPPSETRVFLHFFLGLLPSSTDNASPFLFLSLSPSLAPFSPLSHLRPARQSRSTPVRHMTERRPARRGTAGGRLSDRAWAGEAVRHGAECHTESHASGDPVTHGDPRGRPPARAGPGTDLPEKRPRLPVWQFGSVQGRGGCWFDSAEMGTEAVGVADLRCQVIRHKVLRRSVCF